MSQNRNTINLVYFILNRFFNHKLQSLSLTEWSPFIYITFFISQLLTSHLMRVYIPHPIILLRVVLNLQYKFPHWLFWYFYPLPNSFLGFSTKRTSNMSSFIYSSPFYVSDFGFFSTSYPVPSGRSFLPPCVGNSQVISFGPLIYGSGKIEVPEIK